MNSEIKHIIICVILFGGLFALSLFGKADTGWDQAPRVERGHSAGVRKITISSNTGTAIFSGALNRADGICRSNTNGVIWIGTVTATVSGQYHTNIVNGFPITSSETFKLDGSFTGEWDATCDVGTASCEMRCADGLLP